MINFKTYNLEGVFTFESRVFKDDRGHFFEAFNQPKFNEFLGEDLVFVQDNISESKKNVVRGLHYQSPPFAQSKLINVLKGKAIDIIVDLRKGSATYGESLKFLVSEENRMNLFVPKGFAHGFAALEDGTVFSYKCDALYSKESEGAILWDDPTLNLNWEVENPIISEKDEEAVLFEHLESPF